MNRNLAYQKKWKFEQPKCTELEYITIFENQRKGLMFENVSYFQLLAGKIQMILA